MKIKISMKTPDALLFAIRQEVLKLAPPTPTNEYLKEEWEYKVQDEIDEATKKISLWFSNKEFVTLEFDTDEMTARVLTNIEASRRI